MSDTKKHLTHLESVGLIRLAQTHPELEFMFRHALIRDAAYKSLLREDRKKLHRQVAEAIEQTYPDQLDEHAAALAQHYIQADEVEKAIHYLQKAGKYAVRSYANQEAAGFFSEALALLETLPDTPERTPQEIKLHLAIARSLIQVKGYGDIDVEQAYNRALELCRQIGETAQIAPVLAGLSGFYLVRGKLRTSRELAEQLLRRAERTQDPKLLLSAHFAMGLSLFFMAELVSGQEHQEQTISLYDPQHFYGQDPKVICLSYSAVTMWLLGYPDQALSKSREALSLGRELSHPFSLAYALIFIAVLHEYRREEQTTQKLAGEAVALSTDQGFPLWAAYGTILRGSVLGEREKEEAIIQIRHGIAAW